MWDLGTETQVYTVPSAWLYVSDLAEQPVGTVGMAVESMGWFEMQNLTCTCVCDEGGFAWAFAGPAQGSVAKVRLHGNLTGIWIVERVQCQPPGSRVVMLMSS